MAGKYMSYAIRPLFWFLVMLTLKDFWVLSSMYVHVHVQVQEFNPEASSASVCADFIPVIPAMVKSWSFFSYFTLLGIWISSKHLQQEKVTQ